MKKLLEVENFGATDADSDTLLLECFEDHEAFLQVKNRSRFLIVGRKGSGKTSIFKKMLVEKSHDYFCIGHTFSDYPWPYHDLQARTGIPDSDKYTHSWKYLILLTAAKIILNSDNSLPVDDEFADESLVAMAKIEKFVVDSYGTKNPDITQLFTPSKTLKLKPTLELDFGILKAGMSPENLPIGELPIIVQEVNSNLQKHILRCLNTQHSYFICFDELDLGFDPTDKNYNSRLIGLLLAAKDINLAAKQANKKLFVTVFLRDDIYDILHFEDKNKITENFLSRIEWDTSRTHKTLKGLMEKRFKVVLGGTPSWDEIFDETKQMSGHQSKYQHILDRTYLRPRDIIKFTNSVLNQYKMRTQKDVAAGERFDNIDLNNAKVEYGNYLLSELDDEIHKHLPHYQDLTELLRKIGVLKFSLEDFNSKYSENIISGMSAENALKQLYEFSLVGFYRPGGRGYGGSEYVFKYKEPTTKFDSTANQFRIHSGFIEVLGLKKYVTGTEAA